MRTSRCILRPKRSIPIPETKAALAASVATYRSSSRLPHASVSRSTGYNGQIRRCFFFLSKAYTLLISNLLGAARMRASETLCGWQPQLGPFDRDSHVLWTQTYILHERSSNSGHSSDQATIITSIKIYVVQSSGMSYRGRPSKGCEGCRARKVKVCA